MPFATFVASRHTVEPVVHEVIPDLQGVPGFEVQALPATHMPQKPFASQTCPEPHAVPAFFGAPSTHTAAPVVHDVRPLRQAGFGLVVHVVPSAHAVQAPVELHTMPFPHVVPAAFAESSTHTALPDWHRVTPLWHAESGLVLQGAPSTQLEHAPLASQT